jgi:serine/threonine protein kinase
MASLGKKTALDDDSNATRSTGEKATVRRPLEPRSEQPESAEAPFTEGETIGGRYRFVRHIAKGGMGIVIEAQHIELDERVAIKLLKPQSLSDPDTVARFAREAKTTAKVRSEHSVIVNDVGTDPVRGPYLVMELLAGRDCRSILESEGAFKEARACEIMVQTCEALSAAHALQIVHRDVKPENILLVTRGQVESVKVLDFGISKAALTGSVLNTDVSLIKTHVLVGSPVYMSPEQMRGSGVDARADIWSVGICLYELLSGEVPFLSESVTELTAMVLEDQQMPLHVQNPNVTRDLSDVVDRCLAKAPKDRFSDVGELAEALLPFCHQRAHANLERIVANFAQSGIGLEIDLGRTSERRASEPRHSNRMNSLGAATEKAGDKKAGEQWVTEGTLPSIPAPIVSVPVTSAAPAQLEGGQASASQPGGNRLAQVVMAIGLLAIVGSLGFWIARRTQVGVDVEKTPAGPLLAAPPPSASERAAVANPAANTGAPVAANEAHSSTAKSPVKAAPGQLWRPIGGAAKGTAATSPATVAPEPSAAPSITSTPQKPKLVEDQPKNKVLD